MGRLLALALVGIALLTAGSILIIYRLTEPSSALATATPRPAPLEEPATVAPPPQAAPLQAPVSVEMPIATAPPESPLVFLPPPGPEGADPAQNEPAPIQGAPPVTLPAGTTERQDALSTVRRQRFSDQMDRLNRRNRALGGVPGAGVQPVGPPAEAPGRRGDLSTAK